MSTVKIEETVLKLFLRELSELSEKYNMYIDSNHGGYYAPFIADTETDKVIAYELYHCSDGYDANLEVDS